MASAVSSHSQEIFTPRTASLQQDLFIEKINSIGALIKANHEVIGRIRDLEKGFEFCDLDEETQSNIRPVYGERDQSNKAMWGAIERFSHFAAKHFPKFDSSHQANIIKAKELVDPHNYIRFDIF